MRRIAPTLLSMLLLCACSAALAAGCGDDEPATERDTAARASDDDLDEDAEDSRDEDDAGSEDAPAPDLTPGPVDEDLPGQVRSTFSQQVDVFGATVLATADVPAAKVTHAASVLAEYVDNDEDGVADDEGVPEELDGIAYLVMAGDPGSLEGEETDFDPMLLGDDSVVQPLYADETRPGVRGAGDATIEEVHHLLLNAAWQPLEAPTLDEEPDSGAIAAAMDAARGGQFDGPPPGGYPDGAWYTYDDETCEYQCMVSEYVYWLHTSLLGGQVDRCDTIAEEWRPCTPAQARRMDARGVEALEQTLLGDITSLPDGRYAP